MHHQDDETASQLAPIAAPHALDILGDIDSVDG